MTLDRRIPRLERLEAKLRPSMPSSGPLGALERRELAELEREHARRFPGEPESWDQATVDEFLFTYANGRDGTAQRLAELRHRSLSAAEQAELRANALAIAAMTADELDEWFSEMIAAARQEEL